MRHRCLLDGTLRVGPKGRLADVRAHVFVEEVVHQLQLLRGLGGAFEYSAEEALCKRVGADMGGPRVPDRLHLLGGLWRGEAGEGGEALRRVQKEME